LEQPNYSVTILVVGPRVTAAVCVHESVNHPVFHATILGDHFPYFPAGVSEIIAGRGFPSREKLSAERPQRQSRACSLRWLGDVCCMGCVTWNKRGDKPTNKHDSGRKKHVPLVIFEVDAEIAERSRCI
jgi:hypothetical protein